MKRKLATAGVLCVVFVALVALAAAPTASAKAAFISIKASEWATGSTPVGAPVVTGGMVHLEAVNVFSDISVPAPDPLIDGTTTTHMFAVAAMVDGAPADAVVRGTFHRDTAAGEWDGTWSGTMNLTAFTWDCTCIGRGTSGRVAGWVMVIHNVKTEPGLMTAATLSGWAMAPHGL